MEKKILFMDFFSKTQENLFFIEPIGIVYVMEFLHNKVKNNLVNIIIK